MNRHIGIIVVIVVAISMGIACNASARGVYSEPSFGAWYGDTRKSSWYGAYAELSLLTQINAQTGTWYTGLDTLGSYDSGKMKTGGYHWNGITAGGGPMVQYFSALDGEKCWQWQGKGLLEFEQADGNNYAINYSVTQKSVLAYLYSEYIKRETNLFFWGILVDGRIGAASTIEASTSVEANNRDAASISGLVQYQFSDAVQGRLTATGLYQGWEKEKKFGFALSPEARINETFIFGVKAAEIGGDYSVTGYLRFELGKFPDPAARSRR